MATIVDDGINQQMYVSPGINWRNLMTPFLPFVRLYKNDLSATLDKNRIITDFIEADYIGYAAILLTVATPAYVFAPQPGPTDQGTMIFGGGYLFEWSSGFSQTIYGYYITFTDDASVERPWAFEQFPTPITLAAIGDFIALDLRMNGIDP